MKSIIYCGLIVIAISSQAQEVGKKAFGDISIEEFKISECSFDTQADAMVLFDIGTSKFFKTAGAFNINFTRHKRIKIFKESGREHATIRIPYYVIPKDRKEKVKSIKAFTYNEVNGSIVKKELDQSTVYDEQIDDNWYQKKFVFPDVQEGSILEYEVELITPFTFNLPDWEFQSEIPAKYSEYKVYMVPFFEYVSLIQGIDSLHVFHTRKGEKKMNELGVSYNYYISRYGMKDIEAFHDESYITSSNDYIKKIDFQLAKIYYPDGRIEERITTWKSLRKELLEHNDFGKYIRRSKSLAKKIIEEEIDLTGLDQDQKIKHIAEYVKNSYLWNGYYRKYSSQNPKELIKSRNGTSADINLFLVALFRAANIPADPVILSTRSHGKIHLGYPFSYSTNYTVVYLKDAAIMVDGTQKILDYDLMPTYCINEYALLVDDSEDDKWFEIKYTTPSTEVLNISLTLDPQSLVAKAKIQSSSNFFKAYNYRKSYGNGTERIKNKLSDIFNEVSTIRVSGYTDASAPYKLDYEALLDLEQWGDYISFSPLCGLPMRENPLTFEERTYPVDFIYPYKNSYLVRVDLPDKYEILTVPENVFIDNDVISLTAIYTVDLKSRKLLVKAGYEFKKAIYLPKDYTKLRSNIDTIVDTMNRKLHLTEKK
ncbi:MAG: DUF3857 and transglutaminase domain-containing protein [Bacteroidota bacterium]